MTQGIVYDLGAAVSLLPLALVNRRVTAGRDRLFWLATALAVAGPSVHALGQVFGPWHTGFAMAMWTAVAVSVLTFAGVAAASRSAWRLAPLLAPYLIALGLLAAIWRTAVGPRLSAPIPLGWVELHIGVSVVTYGLLTLAAVAALAAFLQERALKRKQRTPLTMMLPAVAESEGLSGRLLAASEVVLGVGILSGMAVQYLETASLLVLDHKSLLALLAFTLILALLASRRVWGLRGRAAARGILVAYLLLTLAYPGVKFVTDVILA